MPKIWSLPFYLTNSVRILISSLVVIWLRNQVGPPLRKRKPSPLPISFLRWPSLSWSKCVSFNGVCHLNLKTIIFLTKSRVSLRVENSKNANSPLLIFPLLQQKNNKIKNPIVNETWYFHQLFSLSHTWIQWLITATLIFYFNFQITKTSQIDSNHKKTTPFKLTSSFNTISIIKFTYCFPTFSILISLSS